MTMSKPDSLGRVSRRIGRERWYSHRKKPKSDVWGLTKHTILENKRASSPIPLEQYNVRVRTVVVHGKYSYCDTALRFIDACSLEDLCRLTLRPPKASCSENTAGQSCGHLEYDNSIL